MYTLYCNLGGSLRDTLRVATLPTVGSANHEARTVEDVRRIIAQTGARQVMLCGASMPMRAVAINHPKLDSYIRRMLAPRLPKIARKAQPVATFTDAELDDIIDR